MPFSIRRVDVNQPQITKKLRGLGLSVTPIHTIGKGVPDLLVGAGGLNFLFELKESKKLKLTPAEVAWIYNWEGQVAKVTSAEECITIIILDLSNCDTPRAKEELLRLTGLIEG